MTAKKLLEELIPEHLYDEYTNTIDLRVKSYNEAFEEEFEDVNPSIELISWIQEYCKSSYNIFDTYDSNLYKEGNKLDMSIRLLAYDEMEEKFKNIFEYFNIQEYSSLEILRMSFEKINPIITFDEFVEGYLIHASEDINKNYYNIIIDKFTELFKESRKKFNQSDYGDNNADLWHKKVSMWKIEEQNVLEKIYDRQLALSLNSEHPEIKKSGISQNFSTKSRQLFFQCDSSIWDYTSIYDKFILSKATEDVPFIKVSILKGPKSGENVYKIFTKVNRESINDWIMKNEENEKNSSDDQFFDDDFIFFLIRLDVDNTHHASAFLNKNGLKIKISSSHLLATVENFFRKTVENVFDVKLYDMIEKSTQVTTYLAYLPSIHTSHLQFYLLSNKNHPFYMKDLNIDISSKRKIRLFSNPFSFFQKEEYIVEYEVTSEKIFVITGPSEEKCILFFINIFGRFIHSFFLRNDAIKSLQKNLFYGLDTLHRKDEKNKKKKKKTNVSDQHLMTKKKKSDYLQSILPALPEGYTKKYCQCHRQPILLGEEEAEPWINSKETIFTHGELSKNIKQKDIKKYVHGNKTFIFGCPSNAHPEIRLTSAKAKNELGQYILSPCCWEQKGKKLYEEPSEIYLGKTSDEKNFVSERATLAHSKVASRFTIRDSDRMSYESQRENKKASSLFITSELKHFIQSMRSGDYNVKNVSSGGEKNKSSFLECVVDALNLDKKSMRSYRQEIYENTYPQLMLQEAVTSYDPNIVYDGLRKTSVSLDSSIHYRALEEFFKIHIYVFILEPHVLTGKIEEGREYTRENDFSLEVPANKVFSSKTLYHDRPVVMLVKVKDTNEYSLIIDSSKNDKAKFYSLIYPMMEAYTFLYETVSQIKYDGEHIIKNYYSKINWEKFFLEGNLKIVSQEVDISGKTRVIQLDNGAVINIPPCQPFNVPLITEYSYFSEHECLKMFGEPDSFDDAGFWYSLYGVPNSIYVLLGEHSRENIVENTIVDNMEIPLNIFTPLDGGDEIAMKKAWSEKKYAHAIVQIIQWAWRYSGRPNFIEWFRPLVKIVSEDNFNKFGSENNIIHNSLPDDTKISSVKDGFKKINKWWPSMFSSDGKIQLTRPLFERLMNFFIREDEIMGGYTRDENSHNLIGIYESSFDYPQGDSVRIFTSTAQFSNWSTTERLQEENVEIYNISADLTIISAKDSPVHFMYKSIKPLILQNTKNRTKEEAVSLSYHWIENRKNYGALADIDTVESDIISKYKIVTFQLTKDSSFDIYDETNDSNEKLIYIFKYPNGNFASILEP